MPSHIRNLSRRIRDKLQRKSPSRSTTSDQAVPEQLVSIPGTEQRLQSNPDNPQAENTGRIKARDRSSSSRDNKPGADDAHTEDIEPATPHTTPGLQAIKSKSREDKGQSEGTNFPALAPSRTITNTLLGPSTHPQLGELPSILRRSSTLPPEGVEAQASQDIQNALKSEDADLESEDATVMIQFDPPSPRAGSLWSLIQQNDIPGDIFPKTIECVLDVTFDEEPVLPSPRVVPDLIWYEKHSYKALETRIDDILHHFRSEGKIDQRYETYLRYASCFVRGVRNQSSHGPDDEHVLIDTMDVLSDNAIQAICGFIRDYSYQSFQLVVHCDYSKIDKRLTKDGSQYLGANFRILLRDEYQKKVKLGRTILEEQKYVSLADQRVLVTPENSRRTIQTDIESTPELTSVEKQELEKEVVGRPASVLLAVCVHDGIPMRFLYHFLCEEPHRDRGYSDDPETLPLSVSRTCNHELCENYFERFVEYIYSFFPEMIKSGTEHSKKADKVIVPVRHLKEPKDLGEGGFGTVHEVGIDPHYQILSSNVTKTYALKVFKASEPYRKSFERELRMLLRLVTYLSHEHILTHITSWEHKQKYYILYEKANSNLRQHMAQYPKMNLSSDRTLWFFYQLRGLSDAVRRIHFTHEPPVDERTGAVNMKRTGVVGHHHDIKPENILAFDLPENLPTLKLSDFGSGKFSDRQAFKSSAAGASRNRTTETYCGPEKGLQMTRPYDMWALGCVYLEMLLWFMGLSKPDGENDFADMRTDPQYTRQSSGTEMYDRFWQRDTSELSNQERSKLNGAVVFALKKLQEEECKGMQPFQDLIELIRQLLVIEPKKRLKALNLFNGLDAIIVKATVELGSCPTLYTDIHEGNKSPKQAKYKKMPTVNSDLLSVARIDDELSTIGPSRVGSAENLRKQDNSAGATRSPARGALQSSEENVGQQFSGIDRPIVMDSSREEDERDLINMEENPAPPRPELEQQVQQLDASLTLLHDITSTSQPPA